MTDVPDLPRPSQLWKRASADRRLLAAEAFWRDEHAGAEQGEAIATIAYRIKFRLKSVHALPIEKKVRQMLSLPAVSEAVAARLLVSYHLAHQRPMMGAFLDAIGVAHEDGMITDEEFDPPSAERLAAAARTLAGSFPADDVALYLSTLVWQDPDTWGGLANLPQTREPSTTPAPPSA